MEEMKIFQGKTLDEAIHNACMYFDAQREKLEIDIVEDAKSGLFGIVGVRKATIKARRAFLPESMNGLLDRSSSVHEEPVFNAESEIPKQSPKPRTEESRRETTKPEKKQPPQEIQDNTSADVRTRRPPKVSAFDTVDGAPQHSGKPHRHIDAHRKSEHHDSDGVEQYIPVTDLDQNKLSDLALASAKQLITPIIGEVPVTVDIAGEQVNINVECGEDSGILIGREGQTLASVQYLLTRIISIGMGTSVRVQVNAGDYRERQDDRLRELAFVLADRVRATGRACSTRPMSSYHRRIIHLALQDEPDVQTRSSGEGAMKRIIVQKKKSV